MTVREMSGAGQAVFFGASLFMLVVEGVAFSIMWGWFIVPTFNAPALGIPVAIGIMLIATFIKGSPKEEVTVEHALKAYFQLGLVFAMAFIVQLFM